MVLLRQSSECVCLLCYSCLCSWGCFPVAFLFGWTGYDEPVETEEVEGGGECHTF